jgi:hypothetical protein
VIRVGANGDVDGVEDAAEEYVLNVVDRVAERFEGEWRKRADQQLKTSKEEYQKALTFDQFGYTVRAELGCSKRDFCLPVAVELGQPPWDMTASRFLTRNTKRSKHGTTYKRIPIGLSPQSRLSAGAVVTISSGGSWKHPGIEARKIHKQVLDVIRAEFVSGRLGGDE